MFEEKMEMGERFLRTTRNDPPHRQERPFQTTEYDKNWIDANGTKIRIFGMSQGFVLDWVAQASLPVLSWEDEHRQGRLCHHSKIHYLAYLRAILD